MYYGMILLSVCLFGGNFLCNRQYQKQIGNAAYAALLYTLLSALAGTLILLCVNRFRVELTPFTLLIAVLVACNGIAYQFCALRALGSINLSLFSLFAMLGGMVLPFVAGILFFGEPLTLAKTICLLGISAALLFTVQKEGGKKGSLYYVGIFVFNGMSGVLAKTFEAGNAPKTSAAGYSLLCAIITALISGISLLAVFQTRKGSCKLSSLGFAVGGGSMGQIGNFLLVLALSHVEASVQYPMVTGGVMIVCTLLGLLVGEKPPKRELFAVLVAFLSLLLLWVIRT